MNHDPVVLSFYESLLRRSDVELLKGPNWLNDSLISFYFEFMERNLFRHNSKLLFVSPEVTQCIKITPENEIGIFLEPLQARARHFIFFALNDNEQTEFSGGSHWSLMVYSRPENKMFHFDSSRGANQGQAVDFSNKVSRFFQSFQPGTYVEVQCLQQKNGYDCGIHVISNAERIAQYAILNGIVDGCPALHDSDVLTKRTSILNLINHLRDRAYLEML